MSAKDQLDGLKNDISDAYTAIQEKGGEVPENGGSMGLADAIRTIAQSSGVEGPILWENIIGRPDLSNISTVDVIKVQIDHELWDQDNNAKVYVPGVDTDELKQLIIPIPDASNKSEYYKNITCIAQGKNRLTFHAKIMPENTISVNLYVFSAAIIKDDTEGLEKYFVWWSPKMGNDSSPVPFKASSSSVLSNQYAYYAFDGNSTSYWHSQDEGGQAWIQFDFGEVTFVKGIKILTVSINSVGGPVTGKIKGSNDGVNWETISSFSELPSMTTGVYREHIFDKIVKYRYYRLSDMLSRHGSGQGYINIGEIQFYKLEV